VTRRADPRRPDDVEADVAFVADRRLARVEPHPHPHLRAAGPLVSSQCALALDRCRDGIACPLERVEERVALRVHFASAGLGKGCAQDAAMIADNGGVVVAELVEELRRALDVGEQKRDRSGRVGGHRLIIVVG
jgi:hypothetical protein